MNTRALAPLLASIVFWSISGTGRAEDRTEPPPPELEGVGVTERVGDMLPLERIFVDQDGKRRTLGSVFGQGRPVIVTFNYSSCPMLCHLQRDGLLQVLAGLNWTVGVEFDVVTIVIDPNETPERAGATRRATLAAYGRAPDGKGWDFLTGRESDIRAVADAAGFGYRYVPERGEYAHSATVVLCTPEGKIARYLYGVKYDPQTFRLSLAETAEGKMRSTLEQVLLFCFHYDAETRRYAPTAMNVMRIGAGACALALFTYLAFVWRQAHTSPPLLVNQRTEP